MLDSTEQDYIWDLPLALLPQIIDEDHWDDQLGLLPLDMLFFIGDIESQEILVSSDYFIQVYLLYRVKELNA